MQVSFKMEEATAVIQLSGRFDFTNHRKFKNCCNEALEPPELSRIVVSLKEVDYVDSSALGMLLLLRSRAEERLLPVALADIPESIRATFEVANFGMIFEIT
jgi:anti-anti-sigma factor